VMNLVQRARLQVMYVDVCAECQEATEACDFADIGKNPGTLNNLLLIVVYHLTRFLDFESLLICNL